MKYIVLIIFTIIFTIILWLFPILQLRNQKLKKIEYLTLENEFRKTIAQIIGGILVLIGLVFTWEQLSDTKNIIEISEERLITDRYSKAIDQLGSNKTQIRLGGIYSLGQIANSAKEYIPVVNKVLATYIRQNYNYPNVNIHEELQASIDIITYRDSNYQTSITTSQGANLSNVILESYAFDGAILINAILNSSNVSQSSFVKSNLSGMSAYEADFKRANFKESTLSKSTLYGACFEQAILTGSIVKNADLRLANLKEANLSYCDLTGCNLTDANLNGAFLYNANLTNVKGLTKAQIQSAKTNYQTKLPSYLKL